MSRCSGAKSIPSRVLLVKYGTSLMPGRSGTSARAPTLMKILSACRTRASTEISFSLENLACPRMRVTFFMPAIQLARASLECFTTPSLRAFTARMSTWTFPAENPNSAPRPATCAARALATNVLVGMQPTFTQVPPSSLRSMSAVFSPSLSRRAHSAGPAWPVPMTIVSKRSGMRALFFENQESVVGRHREVLVLLEVLPFPERYKRLDIAQPAARIALAQHRVEARVALGRVSPAVVEGTINRERAARGQQPADAFEHPLDLRPGQDVAGVGGKTRVGRDVGPRAIDVELERPAQVRRARR